MHQKWVTFRGTKKQAEAQLAELVRSQNRAEFVDPSEMTSGGVAHHVDRAGE